jgi:L-amino acid N-acyltransferase YncA
MSETPSAAQGKYPKTLTLANDTQATIRFMTAADAGRLVSFAQSLPLDDLLFLRTDITKPDVVARWVQDATIGQTITVLAEVAGQVAGYASLHLNEVDWQRHLGEIRLHVGEAYRSCGLGRALASEIFSVAQGRRLQKIVAQMTPDQQGAIATFERLGFQREAVLRDFVLDRSGRSRDLLMMAYDMPARAQPAAERP